MHPTSNVTANEPMSRCRWKVSTKAVCTGAHTYCMPLHCMLCYGQSCAQKPRALVGQLAPALLQKVHLFTQYEIKYL